MPCLNPSSRRSRTARSTFGHVNNSSALITAKLAALHYYQLSIPAPALAANSNDARATAGQQLFNGKARCATCHTPLYTEPGWNLHTAQEIGVDDFQSSRAPDQRYRTAPLRGLFTHTKGGFYHDGRFATLNDVVDHYDALWSLGLSDEEKEDLVAFLNTL